MTVWLHHSVCVRTLELSAHVSRKRDWWVRTVRVRPLICTQLSNSIFFCVARSASSWCVSCSGKMLNHSSQLAQMQLWRSPWNDTFSFVFVCGNRPQTAMNHYVIDFSRNLTVRTSPACAIQILRKLWEEWIVENVISASFFSRFNLNEVQSMQA